MLAPLAGRSPGASLSRRGEEGRSCSRSADGLELRLGEAADLARKLTAAAAVLRSLPAEERMPRATSTRAFPSASWQEQTLNSQVRLRVDAQTSCKRRI